jgi:Plavaka transposase
MTNPVVRRCPDGHYRRVIIDLAAFIADYPEQVYLSGVVQGWCPRLVILFSLNWEIHLNQKKTIDVPHHQVTLTDLVGVVHEHLPKNW